MRTVGIIAEYNPFHTGHAYHIAEAKRQAGADYAAVVMSPDFVQRGEPAVFDKYTRTRMALQNGADLVLELPVCYATGSAEYFAEGAVALLDRLGVVDALCFGAEQADLARFMQAAEFLCAEPEAYRQALQARLRQGLTYPQARSEALREVCPEPFIADFLASPNNILGVEYCRALKKRDSGITPLPVARRGSGYHSEDFGGTYCSATALRRALRAETVPAHGGMADSAIAAYNFKITCSSEIACSSKITYNPETAYNLEMAYNPEIACLPWIAYIPENCRSLYQEAAANAVQPAQLLPVLTYQLLIREKFDDILDISSDLSDRICSLRHACIGRSWEEMVNLLKTKQMTGARIRRALLHLVLGLKQEDVERFRANGVVYYAKVLGFRREAAPLLHQIRRSCSLPFITKPAHAAQLTNPCGVQMWKQDVFASHFYRSMQMAYRGAWSVLNPADRSAQNASNPADCSARNIPNPADCDAQNCNAKDAGARPAFRTEYEISPVII